MKLTRNNLLSLLNLHFAGVALLLMLNLVLGVRLFIAWSTLRSASDDQLQQAKIAYRALQLEMSPLRGLPQKVDQSRAQADEFYAARFPGQYSTISATINELAGKNGVRLTSLAYSPAPAPADLAEIRMDASLSGEYAPLVHFISGLERSKTFFLITGVTLTGSQGGLVNLRLKVITYLHGEGANQQAPPAQTNEAALAEASR
jgi:type IV pilus assembly protein PilO